MRLSLRQAELLNRRVGGGLDWVETTEFGDREPMVEVTTPRCEYCGTPNPTGDCRACGASVLRDGPVVESRPRPMPLPLFPRNRVVK